ncbi:TonB-dependent receptor plug domain-containing protein [Dyella mobilis]|uniref:TonB-dependent receptor n=1 Tax=Dyella mobilis TaxID=1849582 RepID=A0ABS2KJP1_9GAMM|nr:TonB-dependent receptor [Dyella mobilis]MBM7131149.1 TonB-dependent receptor [Dyella mobilis]GLQ98917.1 membrane protein [Dyella mobilis]
MKTIQVRRGVLASSLALALFAPCAFAQTSTTSSNGQQTAPQGAAAANQQAPAAQNAQTLQKIVVTGSRIPRSTIEGPAPVEIVTGAQIKAQGFTTLWEFLNSMPEMSAPDFQNRISTWGNSAVNARVVNLRNLGPDHTLLLVDGHRVTDYPMPGNGGTTSFQNYNNIPVGMVDHVEVLGSGASSIYGSDAVAGVINVILKKNYVGDEISVTAGGATRGGRRYGDFLYKGGRSGDKWHLMYTYEHTNRSPLWGSDRSYTDADADAGWGAYNPIDRMFGYPRAQGIFMNGPTVGQVNPSGSNFVSPPAGSCGKFGNNFSQNNYRSVNTSGNQVLPGVTNWGSYCQENAVYQDWVLSPGYRADNFFVSGEYDFNDAVQAYGSVGLYTDTGTTNTQLPFFGPSIAGVPNNFYDQTSGQIISNYGRQITQQEMGSMGNTHDYETNWDIHAGLKGTVFDNWDWDFNLGSSKYIVHEDYTALNLMAMSNFFFGPQLGTTTIGGSSYPVYAVNNQRFWNPITPSQYASFAAGGENSAVSWMNQATLNLTNASLFNTWAGAVGASWVFEANHEGYSLAPDPRGFTNTFADPFYNSFTGGGTRTRFSTATEFRVPLADSLTWTISGRIDKYDDHSSADIAKTWGTGIEWRPLDGLLVRGSYGTNFHAPDMQAIYLQDSTTTNGDYADPLECIKVGDRTCAQYQHSTYFSQYQGGSYNLLPETGHSWTYGFVWDIPGVQGLSFSTDYWHMGVNNAVQWIGLGQALTDEAGCLTGLQVSGAPYIAHPLGSQYCQEAINNVVRDANGDIISVHTGPINIAEEYVSGIDSSLQYKLPTDNWGNFNFSLNYTNNLSFKNRTDNSDPLLNTRYNYPATKTVANVTWHYNQWDVTLHGERTGGMRAANYGGCEVLANGIQPGIGDPDCVIYKGNVPNWVIFSTGINYTFNDKVKLGLNISNIFNKVGTITNYAGGFEFIPTQQGADYTGREVFLNLDYKID